MPDVTWYKRQRGVIISLIGFLYKKLFSSLLIQ